MIFNELCLTHKTNTRYALNPRAGEETKSHPDKRNLGRNLNVRMLCIWHPQSYGSRNTTERNAKYELKMQFEMTS